MNPERVLEMVAELRALRFFPNDESVLNAIVRLCGKMCANEAQVRWLVDRMNSGIYAEWPGPAEMRACLCCRYPPKDGLTSYSTVYPDGLPPDPTAPPRIAAPQYKALPAGEPVTADVELQESIRQLAAKCSKPPVRFARPLRDIETPPPDRHKFDQCEAVNPNPRPVTRDDIARAVEELHQQQARKATESVDAVANVVEFTRDRRKP
jgi:hypothetical protein